MCRYEYAIVNKVGTQGFIKGTAYQKHKINGTGGGRPYVVPLPDYPLMTDRHDNEIPGIGTS